MDLMIRNDMLESRENALQEGKNPILYPRMQCLEHVHHACSIAFAVFTVMETSRVSDDI